MNSYLVINACLQFLLKVIQLPLPENSLLNSLPSWYQNKARYAIMWTIDIQGVLLYLFAHSAQV